MYYHLELDMDHDFSPIFEKHLKLPKCGSLRLCDPILRCIRTKNRGEIALESLGGFLNLSPRDLPYRPAWEFEIAKATFEIFDGGLLFELIAESQKHNLSYKCKFWGQT